MKSPKIFFIIFICLFITACDSQQPPAPIEKNTKPQSAPVEPRPALDLSIDNITTEPQQNNNALFIKENEATEANSVLFKTLSKNRTKDKIKLSGKFLTDEEKLENSEYLDSVEGMQINIEGEFE
ncbi:MAG: hypothetical protein OQK32_06815 [Gammaproteobacteria bacterium]|nr:hypothetical protein [Gammaproteobacteria bacterium]MCW8923124.1 hypothetical protein [Gammaproteobacteria bacterium]